MPTGPGLGPECIERRTNNMKKFLKTLGKHLLNACELYANSCMMQ